MGQDHASNALLAVASRDGVVYVLDAASGATLGEHRLTQSPPDGAEATAGAVESFSSPVVVEVGGRLVLLIGARDDALHALDLVPRGGMRC